MLSSVTVDCHSMEQDFQTYNPFKGSPTLLYLSLKVSLAWIRKGW